MKILRNMIRVPSILLIFLFSALTVQCQVTMKKTVEDTTIQVGAERTARYLDLIKGKKVAVVGNQTSMIGSVHLVDSLLSLGIDVKKVLAPEHGFRGNQANGEDVLDGTDVITGLPLVSLYGKNKKPSADVLNDVDVLLFDIQDVGARFYTYLSTLHYIMEAGAENGIPVIVLDRPNPNGFYVDGPVLKKELQSFVGMHPIPIVHGMTLGELAQMIAGEGWLDTDLPCNLTVITCDNYDHLDLYTLPVAPSPNLPNMTSVYLYPSLCLFEGTNISIGRGTDMPFQILGYPNNPDGNFSFTPTSIPGVSKYPKFENQTCTGHDLREFGSFYFTTKGELYLDWMLGTFNNHPSQKDFFIDNNFFDKLAGNKELKEQIKSGATAKEIRDSWSADLENFKNLRSQYLLYADFE